MRFEGVYSNFVVKVLCKQFSGQCVGESHAIRVMSRDILNSQIRKCQYNTNCTLFRYNYFYFFYLLLFRYNSPILFSFRLPVCNARYIYINIYVYIYIYIYYIYI